MLKHDEIRERINHTMMKESDKTKVKKYRRVQTIRHKKITQKRDKDKKKNN